MTVQPQFIPRNYNVFAGLSVAHPGGKVVGSFYCSHTLRRELTLIPITVRRNFERSRRGYEWARLASDIILPVLAHTFRRSETSN
jgi:hypothetical protein